MGDIPTSIIGLIVLIPSFIGIVISTIILVFLHITGRKTSSSFILFRKISKLFGLMGIFSFLFVLLFALLKDWNIIYAASCLILLTIVLPILIVYYPNIKAKFVH